MQKALALALEQCDGDKERAITTVRDMAERDQFLKWEWEEGAHQLLCERILDEVITDLYPGRDTFSFDEHNAVLDEIERRFKARKQEHDAEDAKRRSSFRVVK